MMFEILSKIGAGSFGQVYLLQCTRYQYALKVVNDFNAKNEQKGGDTLLLKLCHENLVRCWDAFLYGCNLYCVMELCCCGSVEQFLQARTDFLSQERVLVWFSQIADVLRYLHAMNVMHRDLKPANIFLDEKKNIKVGDLGIARKLEFTEEQLNTAVGSMSYMSPEIHNGNSYDFKVDIWSLGCCVHEMMTLKKTFIAENMMELLHKIMTVTIPDMPDVYDRRVQELVYSLLRYDPFDRPDALSILYFLNKVRRKPTKPSSPQTENSETFDQMQICRAVQDFELECAFKSSEIVPLKANMQDTESETLKYCDSLTYCGEGTAHTFMAKLANESLQWLQNKGKSSYDMNHDVFEQFTLTLSTKSQSVSFSNKKKFPEQDAFNAYHREREHDILEENFPQLSNDIVRSMKFICKGQSRHLSKMLFVRVMGHQHSSPR